VPGAGARGPGAAADAQLVPLTLQTIAPIAEVTCPATDGIAVTRKPASASSATLTTVHSTLV
jgi:hypothetical protein